MDPDLHAELVVFIRDQLGCGCPDEVLRSIEAATDVGLAELPSPVTRLNVGGRLLVYVVKVEQDREELGATVHGALGAGVAERDRGGFNRFRLVLVAEEPRRVEQEAEALFTVAAVDDRVHLHVLPPSALPGRLRV